MWKLCLSHFTTPSQKYVFEKWSEKPTKQSSSKELRIVPYKKQILRILKDKYAVRCQYQCSCIINNRDPWLIKIKNLWMFLRMVSWIWQRWCQRVSGTGFSRKYTLKKDATEESKTVGVWTIFSHSNYHLLPVEHVW